MIACAANTLFTKNFNLCSRDLKAYMTFGTCTFLLVLLSDTAILRYASVVDSTFQLLTFFLFLAIILWHLSTSPMTLQHDRSFRVSGASDLSVFRFTSNNPQQSLLQQKTLQN